MRKPKIVIASVVLVLFLSSCRLVTMFQMKVPLSLPSDGLVAYYPFNENANDESGNVNDGTVNSATLAPDRFGNTDSAYSFDGLNDYIDVADAPTLNSTTAITVIAWINLRSFSTPYPPIVKKSDDTQMNGYALECHFNPADWDGTYIGPSVVFGVDSGGDGLGETSGPVSITLNEWHFAVGVYDGSSVKLYMDGTLQNSHPYTGDISTSTNNLNIGRDPSNASRLFDGIIDDVRIYNRALTDLEIDALYREDGWPASNVLLAENFDTYTTGSPPVPPWTEYYYNEGTSYTREEAEALGVTIQVDETVYRGSSGKSLHFLDTSGLGSQSHINIDQLTNVTVEFYMRSHNSSYEGAFVHLRGDAGMDHLVTFYTDGYIRVFANTGWLAQLLSYSENTWYYVRRELDLT